MTKKGQKALASATILSLVLTTALATGFNKTDVQAASVKRQGGVDRIATAIDVAKTFEKAENVVLVNGYGYADAVSATPLAKQLNAPILLTGRDGSLPSNVANAIKDLGAKKVYIVGGTGVVTKATEDALKDYEVVRIAGKADTTRFGTNAAVAEKVLELSKANKAILVNGQDGYADALSVASIAAKLGYPVLFAKSTEVPAAVKGVIDAKSLGILAVGGDGVLPKKVVDTVKGEKITNNSKDRFETNLAVLKYFEKDLDFANIYVAAGGSGSLKEAFADALVASAAAAKVNAPLVLTGLGANNTQKDNANSYIKTNAKEDSVINIIGGIGSVDAKVEEALKDIAGEEKVDLKEIKKVQSTSTLVDYKEDGTLKLEMKVNGGKVTVEDLDKAGYDVEFQATEDVFENEDVVEGEVEGRTSKTGELNKDSLEKLYNDNGVDEEADFSYKVVIKKNKAIVGESEEIDVDVINGEATANKINEYKIRLAENVDDAKDCPEITSGKLVEGETAVIDEVKADTVDGKKNADISDKVTLETSDPFIATVDGRKIYAQAEGTVDITIKSGSYKKKVSIKVYKDNDENKRKINKVEADTSSIKLAKNGGKTVELKFLDQYGDPVMDAKEGTDFTIKKEIKDGNDNVIATAEVKYKDDLNGTNKKGKVDVAVKADSTKVGKADLEIKKENGSKIRTIPVEVTADAVYDYVKFEAKDEDSKDFKLDINAEAADDNSDDVVKLELNQFTKNGALLGAAGGSGNKVTLVNGDELTIEVQQGDKNIPTKEITANGGEIKIELDREKIKSDIVDGKDYVDDGYVTVVAKKEGVQKASKRIDVKDSSPRVSAVTFKNNVEANTNYLSIDSILDLDNATDEDRAVKNDSIKISGSAGDGKIRVSKDGIVYIDTDVDDSQKKGEFDAFDIYLGRLTAAKKDKDVFAVKYPSNGEFEFKKVDKKDIIDGTVTIGLVKAHDKTPYKSVDVKVKTSNGSTGGDTDPVDPAKVKAEVAKVQVNTPVIGRTAVYVKLNNATDASKYEVTIKDEKATLQPDGTFLVVLKGNIAESDIAESDIVVSLIK